MLNMFKTFTVRKMIIVCLMAVLTACGMGVYSSAAGVALYPVSQNVSCTVEKDGTVTYTAVLDKLLPVSDDNMLYLLELAPYEYEVSDNTRVLASKSLDPAETMPAFTFPVYFRQENTRLYSKFAMGIKSGGVLYMVTEPSYITNPEALAWNTLPRYPRTKKSTQGEEFNNLFLDGTYGPEIGWIYKTVQVLNTGACDALTNPLSRAEAEQNDSHKTNRIMYYMFNASDADGVRALADSMEYYTAHSLGGENWIIGNEVNVREWNYMAWTDWDTYIREYAQAFRVMYNAIMSTNANARVFVSIDQIWDKNMPSDSKEYYQCIDGKDFLQKFGALVRQSGNINWGLSQHPYTNPMTYSKFWDMSGCKNGEVYEEQVRTGQVVTFQNLSVLTDFMQTPEMLDANGDVRHIILSEIGLANTQGSEVQAAALCASYAAVADNPYIDEIMYLNAFSGPEVDTRLDGFSSEVYNGMDGENAQVYMDWAKSYIGIGDWSELLW